MYQLLSPINGGLLELVREVEEHIKRIGLAAVKDITNESVSLAFQTRFSSCSQSVIIAAPFAQCSDDALNVCVYVCCVTQAPGQFVDAVLEVHTRYSELIHSVFSGDQKFIGALDKVN